ncbi:MAG: hypothetical protein ABL956_11925 [Hyphomonadaceae bacterium]
MTSFNTSLTRRVALRTGALGLGGLVLAPAAMAQMTTRWPLKLAYARVSPNGLVHIRGDEQTAWTSMLLRLGGLIDALQPIQPDDMMSAAPKIAGPASCALAARQIASNAGLSHVILYATNDGQRIYASDGGWFSDMFAGLQSDLDKDDWATGEAHLLDVAGGMPIATVMVDAKPRDPLNLFDGGRNPEREALAKLTTAMERRLQDMARAALDAQRSIAD